MARIAVKWGGVCLVVVLAVGFGVRAFSQARSLEGGLRISIKVFSDVHDHICDSPLDDVPGGLAAIASYVDEALHAPEVSTKEQIFLHMGDQFESGSQMGYNTSGQITLQAFGLYNKIIRDAVTSQGLSDRVQNITGLGDHEFEYIHYDVSSTGAGKLLRQNVDMYFSQNVPVIVTNGIFKNGASYKKAKDLSPKNKFKNKIFSSYQKIFPSGQRVLFLGYVQPDMSDNKVGRTYSFNDSVTAMKEEIQSNAAFDPHLTVFLTHAGTIHSDSNEPWRISYFWKAVKGTLGKTFKGSVLVADANAHYLGVVPDEVPTDSDDLYMIGSLVDSGSWKKLNISPTEFGKYTFEGLKSERPVIYLQGGKFGTYVLDFDIEFDPANPYRVVSYSGKAVPMKNYKMHPLFSDLTGGCTDPDYKIVEW